MGVRLYKCFYEYDLIYKWG